MSRRDPWVTPCRSCGRAGDNFDLRRDDRKPYGLTRYCRPCAKRGQAKGMAAYRLRMSGEPCRFEGCGRPRFGRYCVGHAKQLSVAKGDESALRPLRQYRTEATPCEACGRETVPGDRARGLCRACWQRARRAS